MEEALAAGGAEQWNRAVELAADAMKKAVDRARNAELQETEVYKVRARVVVTCV